MTVFKSMALAEEIAENKQEVFFSAKSHPMLGSVTLALKYSK